MQTSCRFDAIETFVEQRSLQGDHAREEGKEICGLRLVGKKSHKMQTEEVEHQKQRDNSEGEETYKSTAAATASRHLVLRPRDFFVAFGGVVCVAFEGFPVALEAFKKRMFDERSEDDETTNAVKIPRENLGSKWAKASLGAPPCCSHGRGDEPSKEEEKKWNLTEKQALKLRDLMLKHRDNLRSQRVYVSELSLVQFRNRALSKVGKTTAWTFEVFPALATSDISDELKQKTDSVLGDFFGDETEKAEEAFREYLRDGINKNPSSSHHYLQKPCCGDAVAASAEARSNKQLTNNNSDNNCKDDVHTKDCSCDCCNCCTLVMFLAGDPRNRDFLQAVEAFERDVDETSFSLDQGEEETKKEKEDTRLFEWFPLSCLHATVRGL